MPIYLRHEQSFDMYSIHGRMHICRNLIFSETMLRYYLSETHQTPNPDEVRYAVAFHDAGRQGNGRDLWEADSAKLCEEYLMKMGWTQADSNRASSHITKSEERWTLEKRIVHDADILDIMRPICGHGGRAGFRERILNFLGPKDAPGVRNELVRSQLIEEAWRFIQITENLKGKLSDCTDFMQAMLQKLVDHKMQLPFMAYAFGN